MASGNARTLTISNRHALLGAPFVEINITTFEGPCLVHKVPLCMLTAFSATIEQCINDNDVLPLTGTTVRPAALLAILNWMKRTLTTAASPRLAKYPARDKPFVDLVAVYRALEHLGVTDTAAPHLLKHLTWAMNSATTDLGHDELAAVCKLFQPEDAIVKSLTRVVASRQRDGLLLDGAEAFLVAHDGFRELVNQVAEERRRASEQRRAARKAAKGRARAGADLKEKKGSTSMIFVQD